MARIRTTLKQSNIRWSPQRGHIVTVLLSREYVTIRDIDAALQRQGHRMSPATIYQTMRLLCEVGLAQVVWRGERIR